MPYSSRCRLDSLTHRGSGDESKLRDLAGRASGYTAEVRDLLARGVNPNVPDSRGRTAVHVAAGIGAVETLAALLQAYGDSDAQDTEDTDGNTPLHLAADASSAVLSENDSIATIRLLLDHQAEPNRANRNGETPLHLAARSHDRPDGVAALLDAGANPNRADRRNDTPLHAALGPNPGESGIVGALLDGGANPAAVNTDGLTPLLLFVRHGPDRGDTVARLLHAGADPDRKDPGGEAPLHIAIRTGGSRGKVDAAEALLAGGADPCVRDAQGFIPYSVAAEGGPIHQALDRAGGYDRACDGRGETITLDPDQRRRIQAALADAGFDPGPADGQFGPKTHRAIEAWQEAAGADSSALQIPGAPSPSRSPRVMGQRLMYVARPASVSETGCIRSRFAEPVEGRMSNQAGRTRSRFDQPHRMAHARE